MNKNEQLTQYWKLLAEWWWRGTGNTEAICDNCGGPVTQHRGYYSPFIWGNELFCEQCIESRVSTTLATIDRESDELCRQEYAQAMQVSATSRLAATVAAGPLRTEEAFRAIGGLTSTRSERHGLFAYQQRLVRFKSRIISLFVILLVISIPSYLIWKSGKEIDINEEFIHLYIRSKDKDDIEKARHLIYDERGIDNIEIITENSVLHTLIESGRFILARRITLISGPEVINNIFDKEGNNPLHSLILSKYPNPEEPATSSLEVIDGRVVRVRSRHAKFYYHKKLLAKAMIEKGGNLLIKNKNGITAFDLAINSGEYHEIIIDFLDHISPYHGVRDKILSGEIDAKFVSKINKDTGWNFIHQSIIRRDFALVDFLYGRKDIDFTLETSRKMTALDLAVFYSSEEIAKYIYSRSDKTNSPEAKQWKMHYAK